MGLVQSLYTSFLTPRYVTRKLLHAGRSRDHFRYYVVRGSRYIVGHMLDFRKGQLDDGETGAAPVDTACCRASRQALHRGRVNGAC